MKRRNFLKVAAGGGAAAATLAAPAVAQSNPKLQWRLTSGFPRSLDTIYGTAEVFAEHVRAMTDTVEMAHTCSYYYWGKDPTFAIGTAVPFGLNQRLMNAWLYEGGGNDLLNTFYAKHNLYGMPAGNTGVQMGGWWRKEITSMADLQGVKMRIAGLAGRVVEKLGVVPQQIPGGDIYPALERGTIDAAEWVGPYDDEKLGFFKVAPYYYYPGFWEGGPAIHVFVNLEKWNALTPAYQAVLTNAAAYANTYMQAKYDALNPGALRSLIAGGAQLKAFPTDVIDSAYSAADEVYTEISAENADFKAIIDNVKAFRNEGYLWWQVAEYTYDTFMIRNRTKG